MFNDDDLWHRISLGEIVEFSAYAVRNDYLDRDDRVVRELYVSKSAIDEIESWNLKVSSALVAEMVQFTTGATVLWGSPTKGNHLKPLDPAGRFVEFKVRSNPQTRLFGCFVRQNMFIAVTAAPRSSVPSSAELDESWERMWGSDGKSFCLRTDDPSRILTSFEIIHD